MFIILSIPPTSDDSFLDTLIESYGDVEKKQEDFNSWYRKHFPFNDSEQQDLAAKKLFESDCLCDGEFFAGVFYNAKIRDSINLYYQFVASLIKFVDSKSENSYTTIKNLAESKPIQRAFGFGHNPFKKSKNITEFIL